MRHAAYRNCRRHRDRRGRRPYHKRSECRAQRGKWVAGRAERGKWLRGLENVAKRYRESATGRNLKVIMFAPFGIAKPRTSQKLAAGLSLS